MVRKIIGLCGILVAAASVQADVFISEYVEGSGFTKALEIYNPDGTAFDLGSNSCLVRGYQNGSGTPGWTVNLTGSVAADDVYVVAHSDGSNPITGADQTGSVDFNGNDVVELNCNNSALDFIGQIGNSSDFAKDVTLRRKVDVCQGDTNGSDAFSVGDEWDSFANNTIDGLGSHTSNCGGPDVTPPHIESVTPNTTGPTAATTIIFSVVFSESVSDFDDQSDVTVNHSGTAHVAPVVFDQITPSAYTVTVSGISGMGQMSLTVESGSVVDGAMLANSDTLTSNDVNIDPGAVSTAPQDLLISEIAVGPDGAEFIEIYNASGDLIDLSDVYLTDATFAPNSVYYYNVATGAGGGGDFGDFNARFPNGASIASGDYQTVALNGSDAFFTAYGQQPDYELYEDGAADGIADMREAVSMSVNGQGDLSDGEVAVLYYWDGATDLVQDLDYALWGDKFEAVDKTGITVDGPDPDMVASPYLADTAIAEQAIISALAHADGSSFQRIDNLEGFETKTGGNGVTGHNETSEPFLYTWGTDTPTPGAATDPGTTPPGPSVLINEVDAVAAAADEFVEIFDGGNGNTNLTGLTLVLFDDTGMSYAALDLDGNSTDGGGYFTIGGANVGDIALPASLDDGAAAAALYIADDSDFPNSSAVTETGLIDAVVYDSGQADNPALLALSLAGQPQVDEDANSSAASESVQRCPNGSGGRRVNSTMQAVSPTAGAINDQCPLGDYYAAVDATNATTLRTTLHETIDDHQWFPYSAGSTDTWDILEMADEDPNDSSSVLALYINESYTKVGGGNSNYNREHTWPRSRGLGDTGTTNNSTATDAHNLRISNIGYNSDRGSRAFDYCDPGLDADCTERTTVVNNGQGGGSGSYPGNSNWFTSSTDGENGTWEVWHDRRGDVARTMFYMDIRYEGGTHGVTAQAEPDLILTDNRALMTSTSGSPAYMGLLSVLLEWHALDPVDQKEMDRNEVVFGFQGNRNPFVDHPEWVACLFDDDCSGADDLIFADNFEVMPTR